MMRMREKPARWAFDEWGQDLLRIPNSARAHLNGRKVYAYKSASAMVTAKACEHAWNSKFIALICMEC